MTNIALMPKGLIMLLLGGYMDKNQDSTAEQQTKVLVEKLTEYLSTNEYAIIAKDGHLEFVKVLVQKKRKKLFGII